MILIGMSNSCKKVKRGNRKLICRTVKPHASPNSRKASFFKKVLSVTVSLLFVISPIQFERSKGL